MEDVRGWLYTLPIDWIDGCAEQVFYEAREAYRSPGRHYHTWDHVLDCAEKLRGFELESARPVFIALVFHDAVYVAGRNDNEALSANMAADVLAEQARIPRAEGEAIEQIILATKHHAPAADATRELRVALDIDMSILGSEPATYDAYAEHVKREWVPSVTSPERFAAGRAAFLSKLLDSTHIFTTEEGKSRWEAAARANIARELVGLRRGETPMGRALRWFASRKS